MINPHHVGVVDGDGISTPDIFGVDIRDGDVSERCLLVIILGAHRSIGTYWIMTLLAPLTIRNPLPLMTPLEPSPMMVLSEATVVPSMPALSLQNQLIYDIPPRYESNCQHTRTQKQMAHSTGSWCTSYPC